MALSDVLPRLRRERGLTQEDLARKLFVTRQAVSRWENAETQPGVDMCKLIAVALDVPVMELIEAPKQHCESCGMMFTAPGQHGTNADGSTAEHYCRWCYDRGEYTYETTMDEMIEECAPRLAENMGCTLDEAVSLMGAFLPTLERWKNEGQEAPEA